MGTICIWRDVESLEVQGIGHLPYTMFLCVLWQALLANWINKRSPIDWRKQTAHPASPTSKKKQLPSCSPARPGLPPGLPDAELPTMLTTGRIRLVPIQPPTGRCDCQTLPILATLGVELAEGYSAHAAASVAALFDPNTNKSPALCPWGSWIAIADGVRRK